MQQAQPTATLVEHIQELRSRLMWAVGFVMVGAVAGYFIHDTLVEVMQRPLNDTLYYTTPTGAFSFIIKVCTVFGLLVALPVVIYQIFGFFGPLIKNSTKRTLVVYMLYSCVLALVGILFAYFLSLPAALNFLVNFSKDSNITSLITANEYFNFVLTYLLGFAVIFQLPLIVSFINKITPLQPLKMLKATRYVILGSFIGAAIITPTPDPLNQALMAAPVILLYLMSTAVIAMKSSNSKPIISHATEEQSAAAQYVNDEQKTMTSSANQPRNVSKKPTIINDFIPVSHSISPKKTVSVPIQPTDNKVSETKLMGRVIISDFYNPAVRTS